MTTKPAHDSGAAGQARKFPFWIGIAALAGVALGLWLWGRAAVDWNRTFLGLMGWLQNRGLEAAFWLIALQALQVVSTIPGPFFTVASGFLFGVTGGLTVALCGTTLGAVGAYWIARRLPADRVRGWILASPRLSGLERFLVQGGWRVVLATRLIPLFPFKLSNYVFGFIRFRFSHFFWGTLIGIAPMTLVSVSAGALVSDISMLLNAQSPLSSDRWIWSLGGLLAALALFTYAGYRARSALRKPTPKDGQMT